MRRPLKWADGARWRSRSRNRSTTPNGSFVEVGLRGGLGNQLFQLAAGLEVARGFGVPLRCDVAWYESQQKREIEVAEIIERLEGVSLGHGPMARRCVVERTFKYDNILARSAPPIRLEGYFQSPRYFATSAVELREAILSSGSPGSKDGRSIVVHVRRGDYVSDPRVAAFHGVPSVEYYLRGTRLIEQLSGAEGLELFSDDPAWVEQILLPRFEESGLSNAKLGGVSLGRGALANLLLLASGSGYVLSNSTFGWWAAWLAGDVPVLAPRPWFADPENDTRDLLPGSWITLDARL